MSTQAAPVDPVQPRPAASRAGRASTTARPAADEPTLADVLTDAAALGRRGDSDACLTALCRVTASRLDARRCTLIAYHPAAGLWSWPDDEHPPADLPGAGSGDLDVRRGGTALGHVRCDPPASPAGRERARDVVAAMAVLLGQRAARARASQARESSARTREEIAEARQAAAVQMDLVRRELERDLHDGVQADLLGLVAQVALLRHRLATGTATATPSPGVPGPSPASRTLRTSVARVLRHAEAVRDRIASLADDTAWPVLHHLGLPAALEADLPAPAPPGRLSLDVSDRARRRRWPPDVELAAYFVCLEAASNATRHAPGADVAVHLDCPARGLVVRVADAGPGLTSPLPVGAFHAMRERAEHVGGRLDIASEPGRGTVVTLLVPF